MGKFSPFGLLFSVSLSGPIFGFVGDFIDSEKTTVIKFKSAKWNDIHKFNERNPEDLSMEPGKLGKAWLYAKGGEIYEDGFFRRVGKLSDLGDESSEKLANLFEASAGYQVVKAEGSVINAKGINNVDWNRRDGKVEPRSSAPSVSWSELRRVGPDKKLERKLNMRRVSFARFQEGNTILEACELRIRGEKQGKRQKKLEEWEGWVEGIGQNAKWGGEFLDIYLIFIGLKVKGTGQDQNPYDTVGYLSRDVVCQGLKEQVEAGSVNFKAVAMSQGGYLNALLNVGSVAKDSKLITLAGVVVNAYGNGSNVENWKNCRNNNQVVGKDGSCSGIMDAIKKVVSLEKTTSGDGVATLKLDGSNGMEKCQDGTKDWFADRSKKCTVNGFLTHSDLTFRIEQELE